MGLRLRTFNTIGIAILITMEIILAIIGKPLEAWLQISIAVVAWGNAFTWFIAWKREMKMEHD